MCAGDAVELKSMLYITPHGQANLITRVSLLVRGHCTVFYGA
jgi:hypothetical protein